MKRVFFRHRPTAFSLLEILIALGLFAVIISGLMALFPVALHSEKESDEETRSLFIASSVIEALNSGDGHGTLQIAIGMSNNLPLWENLSFTQGKSTDFFVAYNSSCEPVRKLTANEADLPVEDPSVSSVVTLSLTAKPSLPGIITTEVAVASPASATVTGRSCKRFVRLLATPASPAQ